MTRINEQRYYYIDLIRVFAICMVIVLHCISGYYNEISNAGKCLWYILGYVNELSRVGVPLFFMISGFLLLQSEIYSIKDFYKRRFLKICIPFLTYNIFYYIAAHFPNLSFYEFIKELLNNGSAYHLWFIYSILFLYLVMPFIKIIVDKINLKLLAWFFVILIFQTSIRPFINTVSGGRIYLYLSEELVCGHLGYVVLGYVLGKYEISQNVKRLIVISGLVFFAITPAVSMYSVKNGNDFLFHGGYSLNHYAEAATLFLLFKENANWKYTGVQSLSLATMDAYFIHVFILEEIKKLHWNLRPAVMIFIWIIITMSVSFLWGIIKINLVNILKKYVK